MTSCLPFGFWPSPISSAALTQASVTPSYPQFAQGVLFWLETRPAEQGRGVIVAQLPDGTKRDLLPAGFSARSQLLEYGGCPYLVAGEQLIFCNAQDQNLYSLQWQASADQPRPLCPPGQRRFGDLLWDATHGRLIGVMEEASDAQTEPQLSIVAIPLGGQACEPQTLVSGADFYAYPCLSPSGRYLAWVSWNHPAMPWDATRLSWATLDQDGQLGQAQILAGADGQTSINQPQFSPDGALYWVSDQDNWWNLYRLQAQNFGPAASGEAEQITRLTAECATPRWVSGMWCYGFMDASRLVLCYSQDGLWHLAQLNTQSAECLPITSDLNYFADVFAAEGRAFCIAANSQEAPRVHEIAAGQLLAMQPEAVGFPLDYYAKPRSLYFPTTDGSPVHGFFYPPHNPDYCAPAEALPPLILLCHGGPTAATHTALNLKIQYWTSRGFAVMDVNYRGSTGFGRVYRHSLQGQWGIAEVEDLCAAADFASAQGWVHPQARFIKGGSAGGYSVLAALCFHNTFNGGVSLYGIGDLSSLAADTHKFEARYLEGLIGPYPAAADTYYARSPLHFAAQIRCPLLVFQGLLDKVVPPNQAQQMVAAVRAAGTPVTYVEFADEGHGFRQAVNIERQLEEELRFYQGLLRG